MLSAIVNAATPSRARPQHAAITSCRRRARRRRRRSWRSLNSSGTTLSELTSSRPGKCPSTACLVRNGFIFLIPRLVQNRKWPEAGDRADEVVAGEDPQAFVDPVVVQVRDESGGGVLIAKSEGGVALWISTRETSFFKVRDDAPGPVRGREERLMGALRRHT